MALNLSEIEIGLRVECNLNGYLRIDKYKGIVSCIHLERSELCIIREDGIKGLGCNAAWRIATDSIDTDAILRVLNPFEEIYSGSTHTVTLIDEAKQDARDAALFAMWSTGSWKTTYTSTGDTINLQKEKTMTLSALARRILDADTRTFIKAGFINGDLKLTDKGMDATHLVIFEKYKKEMLDLANEQIEADEKEKKC